MHLLPANGRVAEIRM